MRSSVLLAEEVAPALITFDKLILDVDVPLEDQSEDLDEDLFQAAFPNGCVLDIGWYPSFEPSGAFGIALNQQVGGWDPFLRRSCRTIAELRRIAAEFVETAKHRPSIPQSILNVTTAWPARPFSEDLVMDPLAPLEDQLDLLREKMFHAMLGHYHIWISWIPPHSPSGEFCHGARKTGH